MVHTKGHIAMNRDELQTNNRLCDARAPIAEALLHYIKERRASFHVPGHKNGAVYAQAVQEAAEEHRDLLQRMAQLLAIDVTEIEGTDDLHHPTGVIAEAQELAAQCFGAEETHFLVGGSTVGNMALLMSCCSQPGDLILVQRNVHKSVLHALMLAGARAVFLSPRIDSGSGLATAPHVDAVTEALSEFREAKAVFVTNPNYYGMGIDLRPLAQTAHQHGIPLLVDEAHGAHYGLHPSFPGSALAMGADGVVQSTHKMLSGMTMSAMLHVQGPYVARKRLKQLLTMLQSSSPSYPLMASLDVSRQWVAVKGPQAFEQGLAAAMWLRRQMDKLPRFELLDKPESNASAEENEPGERNALTAYDNFDPLKVVIREKDGCISGYDLLETLAEYGCVAEMADLRHVVFVFTLGTTLQDANRLFEALQSIAVSLDNKPSYDGIGAQANTQSIGSLTSSRSHSEPVPFSIYEGNVGATKQVPLQEAAGLTAAEAVIPYPPGIPLLYRGETITSAAVNELTKLAAAGAKCHDAEDYSLQTIKVYVTKDETGKGELR